MRFLIPLLAAAALAGCGAPTARHAVHEVPVDGARAAALVSQYRAAHGLGPVAIDARLTRVAAAQAKGNAETGELSHEVGGAFPARLASFGAADRARAAENLAAGSTTLEGTLSQWKASREHNKNLLMREARHVGIARFDAPGTRLKHFWALVLTED
ncbi:MAG TPA: CAP domain-containing protein [Beijerinckiaceae bacterium]|jgi:uncharacterized protein YkwD